MHICFIYPGFPPETHSGGIGTFIEELVNAISKNSKHVIDIVSRSENFFDSSKQISDNVMLHRLGENPLAKKDSNLLFRNSGYSRHYRKVKEIVKTIHNQRPIDVIETADWGAEGIDVLTDFSDVMIIRCHTPAFISENYNPSNNSYLSEGIKSAERKMLSLAKYIASPSRSLINEISKQIDLGCLPSIETYPINLRHIEMKSDYSIKPNQIKLLSVGRIEERKGQDIIFQSCQFLAEETKLDICLDLIGTDTYVKNGQFCSQFFIAKLTTMPKFKLRLLGQKTREKVLSLYKDYDIYIEASRFDNYPFTLLEAMGSALPVIGNNNSGAKEIIERDETGLIFDGSGIQLAGCISKLLYDQKQREYLGRNASKFVEKNLTPNLVYRKVINTYQHICERTPNRKIEDSKRG